MAKVVDIDYEDDEERITSWRGSIPAARGALGGAPWNKWLIEIVDWLKM